MTIMCSGRPGILQIVLLLLVCSVTKTTTAKHMPPATHLEVSSADDAVSAANRHLQEQPLMLEPGPYLGNLKEDVEEPLNSIEGPDHLEDDSIGAIKGRRGTLQFTPGNCKIKVINRCPKARYFVIAYKTRKAGKKGFFSEGWFNVQPNVTAEVPGQIKTTESLAGRQWYIRFGDGIKLDPEFHSFETARCIDNSKPFQFFSEGTARVACRYPGAKCGSCKALGGVGGHGFYVIKPNLCKADWAYEFAPGRGNCR